MEGKLITLGVPLLLVLFGCSQGEPPSLADCAGDLCYQAKDGMAMVEGDIIIGTIGQREARGHGARTTFAINPSVGAGWARWPLAHIPYLIDPKLPNPGRVRDAITHYHQHTNLRFIPRTTQTAYVVFRPWAQGYCRSWIGRSGTAQGIDLDMVCDTRSVIHEIGHAVGLWHEHNRPDRDKYVAVHLENVSPSLRSNFTRQLLYGQILGPYDFLSVMHYRPFELSDNGQPTVTHLNGSTDGLSNPDGLSAGDINTLHTMYPTHWP